MAHVLLVEDEPAIVMLLADELGDEGHEVIEAVTAAEAEQALKNWGHLLDVLVTDVNLEVRGWGLGFAARAREVHPNLKVIYITGDSEGLAASNGVAGAIVLPKPFLPTDLVTAVELLMQGQGEDRSLG